MLNLYAPDKCPHCAPDSNFEFLAPSQVLDRLIEKSPNGTFGILYHPDFCYKFKRQIGFDLWDLRGDN